MIVFSLFFVQTQHIFGENRVVVECPINASRVGVGDSVAIHVMFSNDVPIQAFSLGFHYDSDFIEVTSFSSVGSDFPTSWFFLSQYHPAENSVLIGGITFQLEVEPANSTLRPAFTLYARVLAGGTSQWINIDTVFVPPAGPFVFNDSSGPIAPNYYDCGSQDIQLFVCGDADASGQVDISDAVYLVGFIFADGPAPSPLLSGDSDNDGVVTIADLVYLINYIFASGPAPCEE